MQKRICIIGASSGIGLALAKYYKTHNYEVSIVVRTSEQKQTLQNIFGEKNIFVCDLGSGEQVRELSHKIRQKIYDFVVYTAGVGYYREFKDLSSDEIQEQIQVNTLAPILILRENLDLFIQDFTKFVYISSIMRHIPAKKMSVYAAMKQGSSQVFETTSLENPDLMLLNIDLGAVQTEMHMKAGFQKTVGKSLDQIIPKLVYAIDHKFGNTTLFWSWWCMKYLLFPLYKIFLGIKKLGRKF